MSDYTTIDIDGTKAAFLRAAGGETSSPVVTPNGLADFGVTFLSNLMAMLKPRLATGGQEYGLASEYTKRIGRSLNTVKDWLRNLEAKDMIHPIQCAPNVHPGMYTHVHPCVHPRYHSNTDTYKTKNAL